MAVGVTISIAVHFLSNDVEITIVDAKLGEFHIFKIRCSQSCVSNIWRSDIFANTGKFGGTNETFPDIY